LSASQLVSWANYTATISGTGGVMYDTKNCEPIDVFYRFNVIHKLYFAFFVTQWFRFTVIILGCIIKSTKIVRSMEGLGCLNCCFGFACLIILHVYRFQPSGKVCSRDYLDKDNFKTTVNAIIDAFSALPHQLVRTS
jgi:hypothetical protein